MLATELYTREWAWWGGVKLLTSGEGGSGVRGRGGGDDGERVPGAGSCESFICGKSGSR